LNKRPQIQESKPCGEQSKLNETKTHPVNEINKKIEGERKGITSHIQIQELTLYCGE
jgi:hypothetical protein